MLVIMVSCSDAVEDVVTESGYIHEGDAVEFTTFVPDAPMTRATETEWKKLVQAYKPMPRDYRLNIEMFKYNGGSDPIRIGTAVTYKRPEDVADADVEDPTFDYSSRNYDGTLEPAGNDKLYWQDNVSKWGFKATAGSETLSPNQRDKSEWLAQDRLIGYSYLPIWKSENASSNSEYNGEDDFNNINFRTPREWFDDNKEAQTMSGLMSPEGSNGSEYKKIPLYMQHERAWVTVILRADEGVNREALYYNTSDDNIETTIYSYGNHPESPTKIHKPWSREALINYVADKMGPAQNNVSTTRYDAIVDPYDYTADLDNPKSIVNIVLSTQKFNFYATSDKLYRDHGNEPESDEYKAWKSIYNLVAGKHLTIEATLSRATLKILITAWVEDWTEAVTSTICDDYGQDGDPIVINNRQELINFLKGSDNKAGTLAIIQPKNLDLGDDWSSELSNNNFTLNATLNMAGSVFKTSSPFLESISSSGSIINGSFDIKENAVVSTAICNDNHGTLERVKITTAEPKTAGAVKAKATQAGLVNTNYGTIYLCSSELNVYGTSGTTYVGGIAAQSINPDGSAMAIIDACTVNANVDGVDGVKGGGIAGNAAGRVTNCTFEYGITLSQNTTNFKNIFSDPTSGLRAYNNSWPTTAVNPVSSDDNENMYVNTYDAVINSETELATLLKSSSYNQANKKYRLSDDFTVSSDTWVNDSSTPLGMVDEDRDSHENGNVFFLLWGNDKTITLTGTKEVNYYSGDNPNDNEGTLTSTVQSASMLFTNVMGEIHDLNLYLEKPVVSSPSVNPNTGGYSGIDAIAPLAYSVTGNGMISNVRVTAGPNAYVQSATPGGLVVWAYGTETSHPTIENCVVDTDVKMWLPYTWTQTDAKQYAGGLVAMASVAKITQCQYIRESATAIGPAVSDESYQTSTNNETGSYPANGSMCFYGGIVGGTTYNEQRSGETKFAKLTITDCSSWYKVPTHCSRGSIIGYVLYTDGNSHLQNAMADGNTGNWWSEGSNAISNYSGNPAEDKAVGKRNSVTPTRRTLNNSK